MASNIKDGCFTEEEREVKTNYNCKVFILTNSHFWFGKISGYFSMNSRKTIKCIFRCYIELCDN